MARSRSRSSKTSDAPAPRKRRYTAGEWFVAILGGALLILFAGIVITSIFGE